MFSFFTSLADAYSAVMMPPKDVAARLQADADDRWGFGSEGWGW